MRGKLLKATDNTRTLLRARHYLRRPFGLEVRGGGVDLAYGVGEVEVRHEVVGLLRVHAHLVPGVGER